MQSQRSSNTIFYIEQSNNNPTTNNCQRSLRDIKYTHINLNPLATIKSFIWLVGWTD